MALLEDAFGGFGGWGGGFLVGLGVAVIGPAILHVAGTVVRPVAKTLVKSALVVSDSVTGIVSETTEQAADLYAEVRAESGARAAHAFQPSAGR